MKQLVRNSQWEPNFLVPALRYVGLSKDGKVIIAATANFSQETVQNMSPLDHMLGDIWHVWPVVRAKCSENS